MFYIKKLTVGFVASIVFASNCVDARVFAPRSDALRIKEQKHAKLESSNVLEIRGGAGPLDPMLTAKVVTGAGLASGLYSHLAPTKSNEAYGLTSSSYTVEWLTSAFGLGLIAYSIFSYCLLVKDTGVNLAVGYALIPWVIDNLRQVLNGDESDAIKAGFGNEGFVFALALNALTMYGSTQDWADKIVKVTATVWGLSGLQMALAPQSAAKLWGAKEDLELAGKSYMRGMGFYLLAHYVPILSIVFKDTAPLKAFGLGCVSWFASMANQLFITKDVQTLGLPLGPMYFWLVFHAVAVGTILF